MGCVYTKEMANLGSIGNNTLCWSMAAKGWIKRVQYRHNSTHKKQIVQEMLCRLGLSFFSRKTYEDALLESWKSVAYVYVGLQYSGILSE